MARKRGEGPSLLGIFKQYFTDHPEWLRARSNDTIMAQFISDHPEIKMEPRVKQAMFNAKNYLKRGKKGRGRRRRRVEQIQQAMARPQRRGGALQILEGHIDDCLAMAKQAGREELAEVIGHLHRARNKLIVMIES